MAESSAIDTTLREQLLASVASMVADRDAALARIATEKAFVEEIDKRINGARLFLGEEVAGAREPQETAPAPQPPAATTKTGRAPQKGSWTEFLFDRLSRVEGGMTLKELTATIPGTEWAVKHASSRNGFYTMLSKLEADGQLVRHDGVIYLPETWTKVQSGEIVEAPRPLSQDKRGAYLLIEQVVRNSIVPLKAGDVVDLMREMPEAEPYLRRNTQLVYATLSRMVGAGILARDWKGRYTLPKTAPDAPEGEAASM